MSRDASLGEVVLAAWHLRYAPVPNSLEALSTSRAYVVQLEPAWCLRYAPDTNLAFACSGTASHGAVLRVELEQRLKRRSCIQISQRIGSAANQAVERTETANSAVSARSPPSTFADKQQRVEAAAFH